MILGALSYAAYRVSLNGPGTVLKGGGRVQTTRSAAVLADALQVIEEKKKHFTLLASFAITSSHATCEVRKWVLFEQMVLV